MKHIYIINILSVMIHADMNSVLININEHFNEYMLNNPKNQGPDLVHKTQ